MDQQKSEWLIAGFGDPPDHRMRSEAQTFGSHLWTKRNRQSPGALWSNGNSNIINTLHAPSQTATATTLVETDIPARLDRLPWGRFHTLVVVALGVTWILDGLEVTLAGSLAGALKDSPRLHFSNTDIGLASSAYLAGATLGAIFFGWLTDR